MRIARWGAAVAGGAIALALAGPGWAQEATEPPAPEPSPEVQLQPEPEPVPSPEVQLQPEPEPEPELECVDVNTATFDELRMLRHVDEDRAQQIIDLRPFSDVDDLGRVSGLAAGGERLAELVAGGEGWTPLCPFAAPEPTGEAGGDDGGQLPVTGAALPLLLGTGAALASTGAGALALARRRRRTFTTVG